MGKQQKPLKDNSVSSNKRNFFDELHDYNDALIRQDPFAFFMQTAGNVDEILSTPVKTTAKTAEHSAQTIHTPPVSAEEKEKHTVVERNIQETPVDNEPVYNEPEMIEEPETETPPVTQEPEFEIIQNNQEEETVETTAHQPTEKYTEENKQPAAKNRRRSLVKNALRVATLVAGMAIALNYWGKKEKPLIAGQDAQPDGTEQIDEQTNLSEHMVEDTITITDIKPEVRASAKAKPKTENEPVTFSNNGSSRFGYGTTIFDPVIYDGIFDKKGQREAENDYAQSFFKDGTMAGGKYQFLPPVLAMEPYGLLTRIEVNPLHPADKQAKDIKKWIKTQSDTVPYMTIYNDNSELYEHYQWTGKHGIKSAQDYYNNHNLQEHNVRVMFERNYKGFEYFVRKQGNLGKDADGDYRVNYNGMIIPITPYAIGFGFHQAGFGNGMGELFPDNNLSSNGSDIKSKLSKRSKKVFFEYLEYGYNLGKKIEGSALTFKDKIKAIKREENDKKMRMEVIQTLKNTKLEITSLDSIKNRIESNGMKIKLN